MPVQLQCNLIVEVFPETEKQFGELWYHQSKPLLCVQEQQCASWCFTPSLTTTSVMSPPYCWMYNMLLCCNQTCTSTTVYHAHNHP